MIGEGLLHALDRNGAALCGCPYGLLTSVLARCTCETCLVRVEILAGEPGGGALCSGPAAPEVSH